MKSKTIYIYNNVYNFTAVKMGNTEKIGSWKNIGAREKMCIINGTLLIMSAICLYFISFLWLSAIGLDIISAGATLMGCGLAFFGLKSFIKSELIEFKTEVENKINNMSQNENK